MTAEEGPTTASTTTITSKNEDFIRGSYNGFSIMIRKSDGFVNATKLIVELNNLDHKTKDVHNLIRSREFRTYEAFLQQGGGGEFYRHPPTRYILPSTFDNEVRGIYVCKELVNIICIKISVKYLHHVTQIMDKINDLSHATHQTFEGTTSEITSQMQTTIDEQTRLIATQRATIETQETHIQETAVPIDNCNKLLTVIRVGDGYKLSANSSNPQKSFIIRFVFPASMNFKQDFKKRFGPYSYENFDSYTETIQHIREQGPKSEIVGDQFVPLA
jgi:hypothetical protein